VSHALTMEISKASRPATRGGKPANYSPWNV